MYDEFSGRLTQIKPNNEQLLVSEKPSYNRAAITTYEQSLSAGDQMTATQRLMSSQLSSTLQKKGRILIN